MVTLLSLVAITRLIALGPVGACLVVGLGLYIVLALLEALVPAKALLACRLVALGLALYLVYRIVSG